MTDLGWIDKALTGARPKAVAALLRYFRDLDTAQEAFQEASLRALQVWPVKGPPRDPAAWLILVGRNSALDEVRRKAKFEEPESDEPVHIKARVVESKPDRATIEAELTAKGKVCATCRGTFVAVKPGHPAYHRW